MCAFVWQLSSEPQRLRRCHGIQVYRPQQLSAERRKVRPAQRPADSNFAEVGSQVTSSTSWHAAVSARCRPFGVPFQVEILRLGSESTVCVCVGVLGGVGVWVCGCVWVGGWVGGCVGVCVCTAPSLAF